MTKGRADEPKDRAEGWSVVLAEVRSYMVLGRTDHEIAAELNLSMADMASARREVLQQEMMVVGPQRPIGEVFTEYRLQMTEVANDLGRLAKSAKRAGKEHVTLGALKAKAGIIDKVIDRGQELGVLPRAARSSSSSVKMVAAVVVAGMGDQQLVNHPGHLNREGGRLRSTHGEGRLLDQPVPDMYSGPTVIDAPVSEPLRVTRRKV